MEFGEKHTQVQLLCHARVSSNRVVQVIRHEKANRR